MRTRLGGVMACWLLALALPALAKAQADKQPEWTAAEKELADKAAKLNAEGVQLYGLGKRREAAEKFAQALGHVPEALPTSTLPGRHPELANSLNIGSVLDPLGEPAKALTYFEQALANGPDLGR